MSRLAVAFTAAAAASSVASADQSIAGVQKVIAMLNEMKAKGIQEKKDEEVAFAEFKTWCQMESSNLKKDITKGAESIESLTGSIGKLGSDIAGLGDKISKLQGDQAKFEAEAAAEKKQREKDHASFLEEEKDFSESVDAIERALVILQKQDYDRPAAAAALLQVSSSVQLTEKAQSLVTAFLGMLDDKDPMDYSAPEANAYEFQSGGIVEILKKLRDEFRSKLATSQKEEMNSAHAASMVVDDLKDAAENAASDIEESSKEKHRKAAKKALQQKQLKGTEAVKAENEKTLGDMTTECHEKDYSFQEKQKLRQEEVEAIAKAIEILSSPEVSGNAEKHLALAQGKRGQSLLQVGESAKGVHHRLREFLASEGTRLHSDTLTLLSQKIMADPFAKVKSMIDAMITRLLNEANEDAKHEGFCDEEMGKSKTMEDYFPTQGVAVSVYVGDIRYWEHPEELGQINDILANDPYTSPGSVSYWYPIFNNEFCSNQTFIERCENGSLIDADIPLNLECNCTTELGFKQILGLFFLSYPAFITDFKCDGGSCLSFDMPTLRGGGGRPLDISVNAHEAAKRLADRNGLFDITASRATFRHIDLPTNPEQAAAMDSIQEAMEEVVFGNETFSTPIPYSIMYMPWEANELILGELIRNMALTFAVITVITFILLANIRMTLIVVLCIAFTITNVTGYAYFGGLTIEIVTSMILIMSVGLALDYSAHIAVAFITSSKPTRNGRAIDALNQMGPPVFHGGFSTFLAIVLLTISDSYIFQTFFLMFAFVIFFGLFHALVFLPLAMSLIGPMPDARPEEVSKREPDMNNGVSVTKL